MKNIVLKRTAIVLMIMLLAISIILTIAVSFDKNTAFDSSKIVADTSISDRAIEIGTGGDGSMANPYTDSTWNGRVKLTQEYLQSGGGVTYFIDLNIDPRNNIFDDNIVIEYKHYTLSNYMGTRESCKIMLFSAKIQFFDGNGNSINSTLAASKSNDSQASFTRYSASKIVNGVRVQIYIEGGASGQIKKYFFFKFGTAPAFTNYI